ncbi:MAG TPA: ABC transporter substrate-binding protein [Syntrophorhabdaceae bacterium]|nr:ABC transporter substrate-binding protein [Syntrophorhabdaceae bacterium]
MEREMLEETEQKNLAGKYMLGIPSKGGFMKVSMIRKATLSTALFVSLLIIVAGQSLLAAEPKPQYGGTLRFSDLYEGTNIGYPPKMAKTMFNFRQSAPAIETLFRFDKTAKPAPWLATGFKENAKARTITLTLRKGVKFHDGTDFNSTAVKWNLDQQVSAKTAGTEKLQSVDVVDDYTIRIGLSEWDSTVVSNMTQGLGMMISPTAYQKNGEEWCLKHPVGTGPFKFANWQKDTRITFEKFDGYWQKGKPYIDRIEFITILDSFTRELSLRNGELDLIWTLAAKDLKTLEKDGYVVARRLGGSGARSLVPDSANPKSPFADVKVRRAAAHAIDTGALVKTIYFGENAATNQQIFKGHWAYNNSISGYPYNPAQAKKLLSEAGYPNGFKTKLLYGTSVENDQVFTAVQSYLKAVGIDAELDAAASGRYIQTAWQGGKWEGLIMAQPSGNSDTVVHLATFYAGNGKMYSQMLVPRDYGETIQKAMVAPDFGTKQRSAQEAMKLMIDKYCLTLPLFSVSDFAVGKPYVRNHGFLETSNVGAWRPEDAWLAR